jgi:hypothetical protein
MKPIRRPQLRQRCQCLIRVGDSRFDRVHASRLSFVALRIADSLRSLLG